MKVIAIDDNLCVLLENINNWELRLIRFIVYGNIPIKAEKYYHWIYNEAISLEIGSSRIFVSMDFAE